MSINAVEKETEVQQELKVESREERLTRLLNIEVEIQKLNYTVESHKNAISELKAQVKEKEKSKDDLIYKLNNGQETFIPVAVSEGDTDEQESDYPSDEELNGLDDEEESTPRLLTGGVLDAED